MSKIGLDENNDYELIKSPRVIDEQRSRSRRSLWRARSASAISGQLSAMRWSTTSAKADITTRRTHSRLSASVSTVYRLYGSPEPMKIFQVSSAWLMFEGLVRKYFLASLCPTAHVLYTARQISNSTGKTDSSEKFTITFFLHRAYELQSHSMSQWRSRYCRTRDILNTNTWTLVFFLLSFCSVFIVLNY